MDENSSVATLRVSVHSGRGHLLARTPTIEVLDEVYDEGGNLRKQTADITQRAYRDQIDPVTDAQRLFTSRVGPARYDQRVEWAYMHLKLQAEGADKETIEAARKDFFYCGVADVYLMASWETGKPVDAVAEAFNAPRTSAASWIRESRMRGYLPPTTKGRAT